MAALRLVIALPSIAEDVPESSEATKPVIKAPLPCKVIPAGIVPLRLAALRFVNACALRAGRIAGKAASGIVPLILAAVRLVNADASPAGKGPVRLAAGMFIKLLASIAGSFALLSNCTNWSAPVPTSSSIAISNLSNGIS